ncbi:MAG: hypothetical protein LBN24_10100 [Mediterranea sp.]|jgi:hypothetical protein|nr:hypothetical protein [Mediterranea sp.]
MKKMILFALLCVGLSCYGQKKEALQSIHSINFYGVDYSHAKVFGARETAQDFIVAFAGINQFFITEASKYNVGKPLRKRVDNISLDAVNEANSHIDPSQLMIGQTSYTLSPDDVQKAVKALAIDPKPGTGFILIAQFLNKADNKGSYIAAFFDNETKEIVEQWTVYGKAGGFGLRNFWAGSVHSAIRKL